MSRLGSYWPFRFARWGPTRSTRPGYTVIVPVPGDLPVFLDLALAVVRLQSAENRLRTVVVPDVASVETRQIFERYQQGWEGGDLVLVDLVRPERWLLPRLGDPGRNHAVQIISALRTVSSDHVVLHDADLFTLSPTLHEDEHALALERGANVVGVSSAWDPWYRAHGLELAATWEMCARTSWLRAYPPHRLMGHDAELFGEVHTFDTTFWAQCHTDQRSIVVREVADELVHFNYVISTYRHFQRSEGPFDDNQFRLLLIRLFIDVFDHTGSTYVVPEAAELVAGLQDSDARVTYVSARSADYRAFRVKLDAILDGPWADQSRVAAARAMVDAFDSHFDAHLDDGDRRSEAGGPHRT